MKLYKVKVWFYDFCYAITQWFYNDIINREICGGCRECHSKYSSCAD